MRKKENLFFYMDKGPAAESRGRQRREGCSQTADDVQAERASSPSCHMDRSQACYLSSSDSEMSPGLTAQEESQRMRNVNISTGLQSNHKEGGNDSCKFQVLTLLQYVHFIVFLVDLHSIIVYSTAFI